MGNVKGYFRPLGGSAFTGENRNILALNHYKKLQKAWLLMEYVVLH